MAMYRVDFSDCYAILQFNIPCSGNLLQEKIVSKTIRMLYIYNIFMDPALLYLLNAFKIAKFANLKAL